LCITANLLADWPLRVIRDRGGWSHTTLHVRFAPKADELHTVSLGPLCAITGREQMQQHAVR
jgi:hypothetical protein